MTAEQVLILGAFLGMLQLGIIAGAFWLGRREARGDFAQSAPEHVEGGKS